ncbi:hypothetical protein H6F32_04835 [Anabaena sp. FACHB-1237]|uniref:hypothetical protein n=1 Tax=Anabaena sp. FACHB-1237 TaxID=2692769 RepID=UPI0016807F71|nr:hypothetical protein [Anabaena sp. FACHB-1237]MBD2136927.1 hypothetical protein [Anabaena sp. FACHB-1237]
MTKFKKYQHKKTWLEKLIAILATINLGLIAFDLSYVSGRDFYFRNLTYITIIYDPIKGIESHRDTQKYLQSVTALEKQVSETGLNSPQVQTELEKMRNLSVEMINSNPFAGVGKTGTLEKIKNRMREHIKVESSKQAFKDFWSFEYLSQQGWNKEIDFFNASIRPLLASNYYRQLGENGDFVDNFWLIDLPFLILFAIELLSRISLIKLQNRQLTWLEAILWRWYDLFLLLPVIRWMRILPVIIRLDQAQLLDLHLVYKQIHQGIVANFAEEITEIVVVRVINQIQGSIRRGEMTKWLLQSENVKEYVDINNVNEIEAIAGLLVQTIVNQVLPKIQPELKNILSHNLDVACQQIPGYNNLLKLPGIGNAQTQINQQLANQITTNIYAVLKSAIQDPVGAKLVTQLLEKFTTTLTSEIQEKQVLTEVQNLLNDFLEEMKINYVQKLSQEEIEQIIQQTRDMKIEPSSSLVVRK